MPLDAAALLQDAYDGPIPGPPQATARTTTTGGGGGAGPLPQLQLQHTTTGMGATATAGVHFVSMSHRVAAPSMTLRARRRREEAVRRLVADVQMAAVASASSGGGGGGGGDKDSTTCSTGIKSDYYSDAAAQSYAAETHDWLVASTVATALEKGLDRDLHAELVQESKDNAARIGQICHDHADVFLASVAKVAALGEPSADLADGLKEAHQQLEYKTAGPMQVAASQWQDACQSYAKARTLHLLVLACQQVALLLERARKQASLGRPRAALQAVDQARKALSTPLEELFLQSNIDPGLWKAATSTNATLTLDTAGSTIGSSNDNKNLSLSNICNSNPQASSGKDKILLSLEQTPFGKRATLFLPKIENEVLMNARRGLNRWFLSLRSEGNGAKIGRSVLRKCAMSVAIGGPGQLGLGGHVPPSYIWRSKTADNLLSRVNQSGKVARGTRFGFFFDRDAPKEADLVAARTNASMGMERRAEAIAAAFGWYRCWGEDGCELLVEPSEFSFEGDGSIRGSTGLSGSRHGLSGSRHGLSGSRHGLQRGSRHGNKRSLGFRATTSSRSQAFQEITSTLGSSSSATAARAAAAANAQTSRWAQLLIPPVLLNDNTNNGPAMKEEDEKLDGLSLSIHPVRRAELAFNLLGRSEEFVHYYEQNRFGEMKIGGGGADNTNSGSSSNKDDKGGEKRSALSSLTGDDVSVGTDRIFFAKTLPHLNASVIGFSAVEAALELGNFVDEDEQVKMLKNKATGILTVGGVSSSGTTSSSAGGGVGSGTTTSVNASRFRESSERYERALISELGALIRGRAGRAQMCELIRSAVLMSAFRASLKIVHPSSSTRRHDSELLALDTDILVKIAKIAKEEQLRATGAIVADDAKIPMLVMDAYAPTKKSGPGAAVTGVPDPEDIGLPFGLSQMKQVPQKAEVDFQEQSRTSFNRAAPDEAFTFSQSVPVTIRALHARAIAIANFALTLEELGQKFPDKKGSPSAGFVLDCLEGCVNVTAIGMKDSDNVVEEGSVEKAVQVMANISALQHSLPRFFGTLMRGLCHIGLIRSDELEETFSYAEKVLKSADKSCDSQVGSTYSLVYEICRNKIDSHINYALDNFNWVAKSQRETPNAYCEGLVGYLRSVFASLGPMDEGSRAGLHFSCCGHVSERLVRLLASKPGDTSSYDDSGIPPISRIDAFGIKNLALDCEEFEKFADSLGIPQLRDCFSELKVLTTLMLDKELPMLLLPEHAAARRRKYPILSLEKVGNILEKYVGTGLGDKLMGGGAAANKKDFLFIDKKEVQVLLKYVRNQGY